MPGSHQPSRFAAVMYAEQDTGVGLGGSCVTCIAGGTLLIGDIVFFSAAGGVVNKANTPASYVVYAGVVIGGARTNYAMITDPLAPGVITAALVNEEVIVQFDGIARVLCDAAVVVNTRLQGGTVTAGRVDDPVFVAGQVVGISLDTGAGAASIIRMFIVSK